MKKILAVALALMLALTLLFAAVPTMADEARGTLVYDVDDRRLYSDGGTIDTSSYSIGEDGTLTLYNFAWEHNIDREGDVFELAFMIDGDAGIVIPEGCTARIGSTIAAVYVMATGDLKITGGGTLELNSQSSEAGEKLTTTVGIAAMGDLDIDGVNIVCGAEDKPLDALIVSLSTKASIKNASVKGHVSTEGYGLACLGRLSIENSKLDMAGGLASIMAADIGLETDDDRTMIPPELMDDATPGTRGTENASLAIKDSDLKLSADTCSIMALGDIDVTDSELTALGGVYSLEGAIRMRGRTNANITAGENEAFPHALEAIDIVTDLAGGYEVKTNGFVEATTPDTITLGEKTYIKEPEGAEIVTFDGKQFIGNLVDGAPVYAENVVLAG